MDYAEATIGKKYAYYVAWFMSTMYYPIIAATLSWVSARYTTMLFGMEDGGGATCAIGAFSLMASFAVNALSPKLAGKIQVSATVIKLVPLLLMGIVGTVVGLVNGNGIAIFSDRSIIDAGGQNSGILVAVCAFAFSYEGWIIATTINSELKNAKRDLPLALISGAILCTLIYSLYIYSMSATMTAEEILEAGDMLPKVAFSNVFGNFAGTLVFVFIIISCLGTTNGVMMGTVRGLYSMSFRTEGKKASLLAEVDHSTGMPLKSCIAGLALCAFWFLQWQVFFWEGPLVMNKTGNPAWLFGWEADEIVIITLYAFYLPIFFMMMAKEKDFVVMGRCADNVMRSNNIPHVSIFLTAPEERRIRRIMEVNNVDERTARRQMHQVDKDRAEYYEFFTNHKWNDAANYDITLNTSMFGVRGSIDFILQILDNAGLGGKR